MIISPKSTSSFLAELPEFLFALVLKYDRIVLSGDFNIHVDGSSNLHTADFLNITTSFNFKQYVCGQTHNLPIPWTLFSPWR